MLVMIPNIQNLKGNQNEERHYYTTILYVYYVHYTLLLSVSKVKKGLGFLSFLLTR